ncbi:LytTR family transcriptional regulator [Anaerocolumna cellulosilytica]|uniref:LytTR family transcriptional regulator n=1 Tax=Anaerocolumna cellulosilytica TaxID=433286 RepID=A0A6S6RA33_9FIRM|nr:LytTR family DNA-binding domain-containing protein [Anaerocolumna cellulosilytica]MBB5196799.1 DNA-binding LytR/AlgR family response regulator [Anaerocolumna cellulosilytica]BCJ95808.1 LytTR family transcriptional regulator [Anaerocolumna cellulosilytica]
MKLTIYEGMNEIEDEIVINCGMVDKRLKHLIEYIRQYTFSLQGYQGSELFHLSVETLFYIESVDGKTFLYSTSQIYESKDSLTTLEGKLYNTSFVRISKSCLVNTACIKSVKPYANHRMEAALKNGERLIISRNYIDTLKEKLLR